MSGACVFWAVFCKHVLQAEPWFSADESGSDSDGAESTSSSYSSLSDFVFDIQNSDIVGEAGANFSFSEQFNFAMMVRQTETCKRHGCWVRFLWTWSDQIAPFAFGPKQLQSLRVILSVKTNGPLLSRR